MKKAVVVSAVRTAVGTFGGTLNAVPVTELGAIVVKEALDRAGVSKDLVEEVILGNVLQAGLGQNPARQSTLKAGLDVTVPAYTVNKVCASGLKAINLGVQAIMLGDADVVVAGGMENMGRAPYLTEAARWGGRMGDTQLVDSMIKDGLWCAFGDTHMGITAENIAADFGISREEQDRFALTSQERAIKAIDEGLFKEEIVPVNIPQRKGDPIVFDTDEHPRRGTTLEALQKLRPAFKKDGTVTAGNASGINDGAAAVVLMSEEKAGELGLKPLAAIRSYASAAVEPRIMGTGPIPATRKALQKAGLTIEDMDLVEANEAFASQAISVMRELNLDPEKTNPTGGAIALGHPIGASGARIFVTLLYGMLRQNASLGLTTLCIGGGQGCATIVER